METENGIKRMRTESTTKIFWKFDNKIRLFLQNHLLLIFFVAVTIIALYVRWVCREWESGDYIIYKGWYDQIKAGGGFRALKEQIGNYGEGYTLLLTIFGYLPIDLLYGMKLVSVFFDFVAAVTAGAIVKKICEDCGRNSQISSLLTYVVVLMLPTVILNGSYWGQCDTVYSAFCLLAILCVLHGRQKLSFVMLGVALSIKMQVILLLPVWVLLWYKGQKITLAHFMLIPATYAVFCIPSILAGKSFGTILTLFGQFGSGAFGFPYKGLNNLSVFIQPVDPYIAGTFVKVSIWFTIVFVGTSMLAWIIKNVDVNDNMTFIALCLFYLVMTTEFMGGLHERHAMLVDLISVIFFFAWDKRMWFIPVILNAHSFLGYIRYCTSRWDEELYSVFMASFMVEAGAYFVFACWLMVFLYRKFTFRNTNKTNSISLDTFDE